ncbi:glycoside hydrolase family 30 protein [Rutstroemia sp. NJR-2017a BBW]|nr:glycoside hydrolase family 30 protein [Rutstroemia sp. NJR-2017a BBW]
MLPVITFLTLAAHWQVAFSAPAPAPDSNSLSARATTITVNLGEKHQTMDGFGFSEAFGRAANLYNLPSTQRNHALDLLFSPTVGAGFTILRNRIGSGGSGDSIEPTAPSSPSATPKYTWDHSEGYQVWLSQQAKTLYNVTRFYANAWSAPGYMKTNGKDTNGGYLCGVTGKNALRAYANFLVQYIKDYASEGITITELGFLNEPDYVTSYSSMQSSGTQAADFIKILHPTLASAGLSVGINCCDMVGWNDQITAAAQLIAAGVENMISRITSHGYSSDPKTPMDTTRPTWMTERETTDAWNANWYQSGASSEGFTWAQLIYTAVVNANVSAYFYWEGIEITTNNAGLIQISGTTVNPSARLWAYGQWSRSVRPGAVRVGTSGAPSGVLTSAFKNTDGSVSVQMLNTGSTSQSVSIATTGFKASAVKSYITNQSNNGIISTTATLSGGTVGATVPGHSMMTFILTGSS